MTFIHIVSFKYAPSTTPEQREECFSRFLDLKRDCQVRRPDGEVKPYILSVVAGAEHIGPGKSFDHTFTVTFSNNYDLFYYLNEDPTHLRFKEFAGPLMRPADGGDSFRYDFQAIEA